MKRRVGIAQALVNGPRLLIFDEPTAGLEPEESIRFRNLLVDLAAEHTVLLSTHIVENIGQTCRDRKREQCGQRQRPGFVTEIIRKGESGFIFMIFVR